ncbi:MAG: carbamoyltransferase C-terminal domain-containing protein [Candidatus Saccharibacteria bacterium]
MSKDFYVLGYSGLDGYLKYKNSNILGLSDRESLVSQGMDAAAALLKNGQIIAASAEERFGTIKHTGNFPIHAINACLNKAGIKISDINCFAHNFNYEPYKELFFLNGYSKNLFDSILSDKAQIDLFKLNYNIDVNDKFFGFDHHMCHAAYAFETSGYEVSLIIVADGLGEFNSISVYSGDKNQGLKLLKTYGPSSSLGMLYSAATDYLGFLTNSDEYKIMGLAAYGDKTVYKKLFDEIIVLSDNGRIEIKNLVPQKINKPEERETYVYFKSWLSQYIFKERDPNAQVEQKHKDFAAALQEKLNEAVMHLVRHWSHTTGLNSLCMAGGVALNCVANERIAKSGLVKRFYVAPASSDDGTSLGAALIAMRNRGISLSKKYFLDMPFYGPSIAEGIIDYRLPTELSVEKLKDGKLIEIVADALMDNKIVAWAQGNMEFGPRALGHRSILAIPCDAKMRERLNIVTKQRESFRPFAPIVKKESINKYFETYDGVVYKHMLVNTKVREKYRSKLQAVIHIDGTSRAQAVDKKDLPLLWKLLDEIERRTTIPVLLNTSFNLKSMPIVCYKKDAIDSYLNSDIDLLVIDNEVIRKRQKK